ncbi:hypothetical protein SISSUDRAFT_1038925 [Sistotremastrum suecicum HHB10207 ss-3]|uniref:THIF-type NAD/FAD binding fold domain-containing protein n=1 Tax=Sistotremastrum suecicum HHB10207 ss-3 TaxID=1314776 RepID=A0A166J6B8_9AGAM|nr:hypothetical protein SISSUDRAFT_1038925 [Sistotremastrum suecicum HHB10207 ss-3]
MASTGEIKITEDEAALYDRQIRLWGLDAQQRMRNGAFLVMRCKGVATEAIKNIVLAGIGKLILVDPEDVTEEDLGAGFFFRDDDVGTKRADAAKSRIESLNPLVRVEVYSDPLATEGTEFEQIVKNVDMVCVTEASRSELLQINDLCRRFSKPFYAGGTYGLLGYIFCDLLTHEYLTPDRSAPKDASRNVKTNAVYPSLKDALHHSWKGLKKKQTRDLNPSVIFGILGLWEFQAQHGRLPEASDSEELQTISSRLIQGAQVDPSIIKTIDPNIHQQLVTTAAHEFSPVCAVIGGVLAQDMLKALAAQEAPLANFFTFDGSTGGGSVCRMSM